MGKPLYTNNAFTNLASGISPTDTVIQVASNTGILFPSPTGGDYFYMTLISTATGSMEIVQCTSRTGDYMTVTRGAEGTVPQWFSIGDNAQLRITAAGMNFITGANGSVTTEETQTATQGQTLFTLATIDYAPNTNNIAVFVNGSKQISGTNFTETSVNSVTFTTGLNVGDVVEFVVGSSVASGTIYATDVNYLAPYTNAVKETLEALKELKLEK